MTTLDKDNKYWNGHRMVVKFGRFCYQNHELDLRGPVVPAVPAVSPSSTSF